MRLLRHANDQIFQIPCCMRSSAERKLRKRFAARTDNKLFRYALVPHNIV